jgi:hypothetical protein
MGGNAVSDAAQQLVMQYLNDAHDRLSVFARDCYNADGRGMIIVEFPLLPPRVTAPVSPTVVAYQALIATRDILSDLDDDGREGANVLLRVIQTYDPTTHAVVHAFFTGGEGTVSVKMRLTPAIEQQWPRPQTR